MAKIIATYSPCCGIFREGDADQGVMHCALPHERQCIRLVDARESAEGIMRMRNSFSGESVPDYCEPRDSPLDAVVSRAMRANMPGREEIGRVISALPAPQNEALKDYMAYELLLKARDLVGIARVGELVEWIVEETT